MVVGRAQASQLEDRRPPTTTLDGWKRFVTSDPPAFDLLPDKAWAELDEGLRRDYDEARIAHHAELVVVTTSAIEEITIEGRLLTLLNQREEGARRGLIVSGEATTGKTTAIKQLGRMHELRVRKRHPGIERIPVVYVTAPPKGSPRKLAVEFDGRIREQAIPHYQPGHRPDPLNRWLNARRFNDHPDPEAVASRRYGEDPVQPEIF